MKKHFSNRINIIALCSIAFIAAIMLQPQAYAATTAGRVIFATGSITAIDTAGTARTLNRGNDVFSGDNLTTGTNSRLQISFVDGAYISLQPNSQYKIDEYQYSGKADDADKAHYSLLKGGVRAVTGLIGKKNPEAYKVQTAVATIGIRGTGHNTRICQGDCPGKKDGLYHSTWEGTTYVKNNQQIADVPTGKSVFVKDINAKIEFTNQPAGVTAVETTKQKSEQQREREESNETFFAGDQRNEEGDQIAAVGDSLATPTFSETLSGLVLQAVQPHPDGANSMDADVIGLTGVTVFKDADGNPIGVFGLEEDNGNFGKNMGTIDINAMLGANDTALAEQVRDLFELADAEDVRFFQENPAQVLEFFTDGEIGYGRWGNGRLLTVNEIDTTPSNVHELTGNQSVHFIFGPAPGAIPASGSATYSFIGGTQSTSVSGATIGDGAINGNIFVNFASSNASISMDVNHDGDTYAVSGSLIIDGSSLFDNNVTAMNLSATGACYPGCPTLIDGGFAGPDNGSGTPKHIGIEYDIQDTDVITGVAAFKTP